MASVTKEIIVNAPVEEVFGFWKNFENFPRFMENIESITVIGPEMTHWKMRGPSAFRSNGTPKRSPSKKTRKSPGSPPKAPSKRTAPFCSRKSNPMATSSARKSPSVWNTKPPAGALGEVVAKLLNDPEKQLEDDLMRFKRVVQKKATTARIDWRRDHRHRCQRRRPHRRRKLNFQFKKARPIFFGRAFFVFEKFARAAPPNRSETC